MEEQNPVLRMNGINKSFLGVKANQDLNFELYPREICALLGENGAGKSTLMKILFGLYKPDTGEIYIHGQKADIKSPRDAIRLGVGMVHQHFNLVSTHQVWENLVLGLEDRFLLDKKQACQKISDFSHKFGLDVNPEAYVWQLSAGEKQRIEIIKVLLHGAKILILDEPTAVLTMQESEALFSVLQDMTKSDYSVIFISHKLREVIRLTDRVVVLRRGKVIDSPMTAQTTEEELARLMMGDEKTDEPKPVYSSKKGREILRIENLSVASDMGFDAVRDVSFGIHEGEILGLAGVSGNGQRELAQVLSGVRELRKGKIYLRGDLVPRLKPSLLINSGWGRIPEDRMTEGLLLNLSLMDNLLLEVHTRPEFRKGPFLNLKKAKNFTEDLIHEFDVRSGSYDLPVHHLSGGNMQKLLLARELFLEPRFIVAGQPTRGLDVKGVRFIQNLLLRERERGTAILLISEDLDEIMSLSDRIAVIYEGEIMEIFDRQEANRSRIGLMMAGVREDHN